jgi:hypothetical protein
MSRRFLVVPALISVALVVMATAVVAAPSGAFVASLTGDAEVPARDTDARGTAVFRVSPDGDALYFQLVATGIDNVVASHIHLGAADENGPVVAFLYGPAAPGGGRHNGLLAAGTITADDLVGPLAGEPLSALLDAMSAGGAYVNVHTNDGLGDTNTGPGDFPGGEIRGQIH